MESGHKSDSGIFIHGTVVANTDSWVFFVLLSKNTPIILSAIDIFCYGGKKMKKERGNSHCKEYNFQSVANKVSINTIIGNMLLAILKFLSGVIAHSNAMISDAIHSASDVFSTFVVIIGIRLASKKPDKEHPYGHERLECVAAIILSMVLFITGLWIGIEALQNIIQKNYSNLQVPGVLALIAAGISIISKEVLYTSTFPLC